MKQTKFLLLGVILLIGTTFTSCLNGDSESLYDIGEMVTIEKDAILTPKIIGDFTGYTYIPSNPQVIRYQDLTYPERAILYFKLDEGEVITEGKTKYKVSIVPNYTSVIPTKDFNYGLDTLKTYNLIQFRETPWQAENYLSLQFDFKYTYSSIVDFDLCPTKAEGDILHLKFNHSVGNENAYEQGSGVYSFRLPNKWELQSRLDELEDGGTLDMEADSITFKIWGEGPNSDIINAKPVKVALNR